MRLLAPSPSISTKESRSIKAPLLRAVGMTAVTSRWQGSPLELRWLRFPLHTVFKTESITNQS